jgi:hypothetical protein
MNNVPNHAPQPVVLHAPPCTLPDHACAPTVRRGFTSAQPVMVTHRHGGGKTSIRLVAHRPWEITHTSLAAAIYVFELYAAADAFPRAAAVVADRSVVLISDIPDALAEMVTQDLAAVLRFVKGV